PRIFELGVPLVRISYGMQLIAHLLGGKVDRAAAREYGAPPVVGEKPQGLLHRYATREAIDVCISHGHHSVSDPPPAGTIDAARDRFTHALGGLTDPEQKRKTIGRVFIEVFEEQAKKVHHARFLIQGTLYPDVIESVSFKGPSAVIKSHHNVGGLPERMHLQL